MTTLAVFSDLHVHPWEQDERRLEDCLDVLDQIVSWCVEHRPDAVLFGGDLVHKRGVWSVAALDGVVRAFMQLQTAGIPLLGVVGNHDQDDKRGHMHALKPLKRCGLIAVPNARDGWGRFQRIDGNDVTVSVTGFNYCDGRQVLAERVAEAVRGHHSVPGKRARWRVGLFHHGFKGARVGSALEYEVKEPIDAAELRLDDHFDVVISGHYHAHQAIEGCAHGVYCGSPIEHTRGDGLTPATEDHVARLFPIVHAETPKGFLVYDFQATAWTMRRVPLAGPRFVRLDSHIVSMDADQATEAAQGNFADVVDTDGHGEEACAHLLAHGARRASVVQIRASLDSASQDDLRTEVTATTDPKSAIEQYVDYMAPEVEGRDRERLVRTGLMIWEEL